MRKKYSFIFYLIIAVVLSIQGIRSYFSPAVPDAPFVVHFIDVGQADAALIVSEGASMLIDGGNREDSDLIATYLEKQNISYLDYVICSHAHEDHVGGLSGALATVRAGAVFAPETGTDTKVYRNFLAKIKEQGLSLQHPAPGKTLSLGSATVEFLGPVTEETEELNDTSIILKVTYGETSFLFTGDAERESELRTLDAGADVSATVLKVGHHGSSSSTSYPFLREASPEVAIISCGVRNDYGHPHDEVLSRLSDAGVSIYRTDEEGDIIVTSDGSEINVYPQGKR